MNARIVGVQAAARVMVAEPVTLDGSERAACAAMAHLLHAAAVLALYGLVFSAVAAAALLLGPGTPPAVSVLLAAALAAGLVERYLALRVWLDAGLFADLASGQLASLPALDGALARLGLRAASAVPRGLDARLHGAGRLLRWHAAVLVLQAVLLIGAGCLR